MIGLGAIISFIPNIITAAVTYFTKKEDVSLEKYKVDGKLDEARVLAALQSRQQWTTWDRAMLWAFAYPLGAWWTLALVNSGLKSLMGWTWVVHSFPLLEQWGWAIVAYLFFAATRDRS